jgi:pyruvate ferredoxin oxidoreductase alpha subunit
MYMAECLTYVAGGRFPIVMMNANRALALPWNIYGDQRDSLSLLDHGWIQVYAESNQEALDLALVAYALGEDARVMLPVMVNLDGFALTHTYESVEVPTQQQADAFLPPYATTNQFNFEAPTNIGYSAGPEFNRFYAENHHRALMNASEVIEEVEARFAEVMGRSYTGLLDAYRAEDAELIVVTLGSLSGLAREVVDALREEGVAAGVVRIRYMRPFPREIASVLAHVKAFGVIEKDISFGGYGAVYTNVTSALGAAGVSVPSLNFVGGLGGHDITRAHLEEAFEKLQFVAAGAIEVSDPVIFIEGEA